MDERKEKGLEERALDLVGRHWRWLVFLTWVAFCIWAVATKWTDIRWFNLGDTDDNMRMMQVRGLLHGQGWFDLRQYRLNPPLGANIHWSRLVDLPIAGLILALRPFLGGAGAEKWAVAIAPLLPALLMMGAVALTARRLIDRNAYPLALLAIFFAGSTYGMYLPERIDHHGWQLAFLALSLAGVADPKRVRGGLVLGISSALSLAIGLEMIIYLAIMAAALVLTWIDEREERDRLSAYALSMTAATALAYLLFASNDNRFAVCDALSPVWLSDAVLGGALLYGLAWLSPGDWKKRLALAAAAGIAVAAFHALSWPHCLQRLEGVSPEVERLWLSHVREARPIYLHGWRVAALTVALPVTGAIGWLLLAWRHRRDRDRLRRILSVAAPGIAASLLLLWQTRTAPAAQLMAVVGAAAFCWVLVPLLWRAKTPAIRILGVALVVIVALGAAVPLAMTYIPDKPKTDRDLAIGRANRLCASMWGLHPIAIQPKGMVFTFVDFGPRIITVTPHDAVAGPYHRNGQQIADIMNAFRGDAEQAHRLISKYHSDYLLTCPNSSTTTIFVAEAPKGFYAQLQAGKVPNWLQPVALPADSPFKMWRVTG
jgi:hypothetical protein